MTIRLDVLKKLESSSLPVPSARQEDEVLEVIVKVRKKKYTPPEIQVRARIDDFLFTGKLHAKSLKTLEKDPEVISIALNKKLQVIE